MRLPPLKSVTAFEVVARLGSVNKAADELNVTASAVSHQIANLEGFVGRRLFERTSRGLVLTAVGESFKRDVTGALALIASAAQNARSAAGVETLRIHVVPSFGNLWLMPRLPAFLAAHRELRVQLSASPTPADFSRGDVDLDVRYGTALWPNLHIETIFAEEILPLASPAYLREAGIRAVEDLLGHALILSDVNLVQWTQWFASHGVPVCPAAYALRFDRAYLALDAAVQGLGIALESDRLAERALARGDLAPVFPDRRSIVVHAHHLVYPPAHDNWKKVASFRAWMREQAGAVPRRG